MSSPVNGRVPVLVVVAPGLVLTEVVPGMVLTVVVVLTVVGHGCCRVITLACRTAGCERSRGSHQSNHHDCPYQCKDAFHESLRVVAGPDKSYMNPPTARKH